MNPETPKPCFRTRARILNQLGEQLIKNESIALLELIKNAYDADATVCTVVMKNPSDPLKGEIIIHDDGCGMDYTTIVGVWLEIGTNYKEQLAHDFKTKKTPLFHRMRLGEKGIGRLGVHRLGKKITLITKSKNSEKEICLTIDWNEAEHATMIEDIPLKIETRSPERFRGKHSGTFISITDLRVGWTRKLARDCARTISALNSPFEAQDSFRAIFTIEGTVLEKTWLDGLLSFDDIRAWKLFSFDITMKGMFIEKFKYEFIPWETMPKLTQRKVQWSSDNALARIIRKETDENTRKSKKETQVDLGKPDIGTVRFQGVIFDRDSKTLSLGLQDKSGLKEYLDANGGIRVFRDNMRVLDYGEPGNDWLDLNSRRVNSPVIRVSNNVIIGAVYLDRGSSCLLIEKANREGFIKNEAYDNLHDAVVFCLERVESYRNIDKDILRKTYGPQETSIPVITSVTELRETVELHVRDEKVKSKILHYLTRVESEYEKISDSLIRSAGAGLNLTMVIHQMAKIILNVQSMLKQKASTATIEGQVKTLSALVEGYSILVKSSEKKERNLKGIIKQSVFNVNFRLEAHKISLVTPYRDRIKTDVICSENHVLNALLNIFDNSIWWLGYARTVNPTIFVDISDAYPKHTSIVIADNGPGFTKSTEEIIKPFVSDKPNGMGIGLHLTDEIMKSLNGKLVFPGLEIFDIPKKFAKGAIIALAFPKKEK